MSIHEIFKKAPRYLTSRYNSLNSYVWDKLFPKDYVNRKLRGIKDENVKKEKIAMMKLLADEVSFMVFVFVMRKIFTEGATASKNTVDILKELGVDEFYLGSTKFTERNDNVIMGDILAERLMSCLDDKSKIKIQETKYISELIDSYQDRKKDIYA